MTAMIRMDHAPPLARATRVNKFPHAMTVIQEVSAERRQRPEIRTASDLCLTLNTPQPFAEAATR